MENCLASRRRFLKSSGVALGAICLPPGNLSDARALLDAATDYTIRIAATPVEIAPDHILSTVTYNGQFPGPLR